MSTTFVINRRDIAFDQLVPRLAQHGIREVETSEGRSERQKYLTDGKNGGIWVFADDRGMLCSLTRYVPNGDPGYIRWAIHHEFDVQIEVYDGCDIETAGHDHPGGQQADDAEADDARGAVADDISDGLADMGG